MKTGNLRNYAILLAALLTGCAQVPAQPGATSAAKPQSGEPKVLHVLDGTANNSTVQKSDGVTLVLASEDGEHFRALGGFANKVLFGRIDANGLKTPCPAGITDPATSCFEVNGTLYLGGDGSGFPADTRAGLHLSLRLNAGKGTGDYRIAPIGEHLPQAQLGTLELPESVPEPDAGLQLARSLHQAGEHEAAFATYDRLLSRHPDNADIHWQRGQWQQQLNRDSAANNDYRRVNELQPEFADGWGNLGWNLIMQGDLAEAQRITQKAQDLDPYSYFWTVNLGHTYLLQGDAKTAQDWYQKTLSLIPDGNALKTGPLADFDLFIEKGWQVEASRKAKSWFEKGWPQWKEALRLDGESAARRQAGHADQAVPLAEQALEIVEKLFGAGHPTTGIHLNNLAKLYYGMEQYTRAEPLYIRSLVIAENSVGTEHPETAICLNNLAMLYKALGKYARAEPLLVRALAILEKANGTEHPTTGTLLSNLALLYQAMGQYARAEPLVVRALAISEKAEGPDHPNTGTRLNNLAELYRAMGQYARAEPYLVRGLAIFEKVKGKEHPDTGAILNNLAELYRAMGQNARAESLYVRALAIAEKFLGSKYSNTDNSLSGLALLYESMGQYARAEPLFVRSLTNAEKSLGPDHPSTGISLNNLALLYKSMGQYARAEPLFVRALAISEKAEGPEHPTTGIHLNNLAGLYQGMRQYARAEQLYVRALAIFEKAEGPDHPSTGASLNNLAVLYHSMGHHARAEPLYLRAWRITSMAGSPELAWKVQDGLRKFYTQSHPDLAIWYGKQAVNTLQAVRADNTGLDKDTQKSFLQKNEDTYKSLADLLFTQGRLIEGQQVLAMLKEAEYFDFIQRSSATDPRKTKAGFDGKEKPLADTYDKISGQLVALSREREALIKKSQLGLTPEEQSRKDVLDANLIVARKVYDDFTTELKREFAQSKQNEFAKRSRDERIDEYSAKNINTLRALQGTLRDLGHGAVTLHYLMTDKRLWILLTTPTTQLKREAAISEAELNKQIGAYRAAIDRRDPKIKEMGRALYDLIIAPVAIDLKQAGAQTLMLSLDGGLRYLPIAALYDGEKYLAQRYRLAIYTTAATSRLNAPPKADWKLAGFGMTRAVTVPAQGAWGKQSFSALTSVKGELEGIKQDMEGTVKLDQDFTAKALQTGLESDSSVVHLASHFVFKPGNETDSFLLLGDGNPLSLAAIRNYDFKDVELLTLSACETAVGGGKDANGREVEGFGVQAQEQGAKGVIATLWSVDDQGTGQFMRLLYGFRQQNPGMTKAEAMQKAQLAFIEGRVPQALAEVSRGATAKGGGKAVAAVKAYDNPYYWAPFILMGNWL